MKIFSCLRQTPWLFFAAVAVAAEPATVAPAQPPATAPAIPLTAFAALGSEFAQSNHLVELGWDDAQISAFVDGIRAAFQGKGYPFDEAAQRAAAEMARRMQEVIAREQQQQQQGSTAYAQPGRLEQYMKEMRKRLGLQQADSGLAYRVEVGRGGPRPRPGDTVVFTCVATAADGTTKLPQLTAERVRIKMSELMPGFGEVLQMMTVDSTAVFVLPPALSFGQGRWPEGVERGTPLVFTVVLHEVISPDAPP
jgi:FKBP-type peptidyl-prolyl cis-trans isomerase